MNASARCRLIALFLLGLPVAATAAAATGAVINFASLDRNHPFQVAGTLYRPNSAPAPAVVMVHGTTGIDARGAYYRDAILDAGIAVFEVDFKSGIYSGPADRPSPDAMLAMGFAALHELRKLSGIDPQRIGVLGFSMGGHLAVGAAFESNRKQWLGDEKGFAAHVAFYPVCSAFLKRSDLELTGAPMIIFYGSEDAYGDGEAVPKFKSLLKQRSRFDLTTIEYAGAAHGFNRNAAPLSYRDPAAIGGRGYMAWNEPASRDSLGRVVAFLRQSLAAK